MFLPLQSYFKRVVKKLLLLLIAFGCIVWVPLVIRIRVLLQVSKLRLMISNRIITVPHDLRYLS